MGFITYSEIQFLNNTFEGNYGFSQGGAIYIDKITDSRVIFKDNRFINNLAQQYSDLYINIPNKSVIDKKHLTTENTADSLNYVQFLKNTFKNS